MANKYSIYSLALFLAAVGITFTYSNCAKFEAAGSLDSSQKGALQTIQQSANPLRRLSVNEIDRTLLLLLNDGTDPAASRLPADSPTPFDNDYDTQIVSTTFISNAESLANDVTNRLFSNTARRNSIIGCVGSVPTDTTCMRSVITNLGRLFFRRALTPTEVSEFETLAMDAASSASDFDEGAKQVLRALIQHPRFLYRFEDGTTNGGITDLDGYSVAARLSFFLWGAGPDDALLDLAEAGNLDTPAGIRTVATTMLTSPMARERIAEFHSMWMGYGALSLGAATNAAYIGEADRMVQRIILDDNSPWPTLFTTTTTEVDSIVAGIYGLTGIATFPATATMPAGILGTPAFLSVVPKFGDTSPTNRGRFVQERLLCRTIPDPPPSVNADEPPPGAAGACKEDRYVMHRQSGTSCFFCHQNMDPIGFGLEQYDNVGRFRDFDYNMDGSPNTDCSLASVTGGLPGIGDFQGPAQLGSLIITDPALEACMVRRVFQFMAGRQPASADNTFMDWLTDEYISQGQRLQDLILSIVTSDPFRKAIR